MHKVSKEVLINRIFVAVQIETAMIYKNQCRLNFLGVEGMSQPHGSSKRGKKKKEGKRKSRVLRKTKGWCMGVSMWWYLWAGRMQGASNWEGETSCKGGGRHEVLRFLQWLR